MKAKDLRIGNWIEWREIASMGIGQEQITLQSIKHHFDYIDFLRPIPITEEWLLKFGFEKKYIEITKKYTKSNGYKMFSL